MSVLNYLSTAEESDPIFRQSSWSFLPENEEIIPIEYRSLLAKIHIPNQYFTFIRDHIYLAFTRWVLEGRIYKQPTGNMRGDYQHMGETELLRRHQTLRTWLDDEFSGIPIRPYVNKYGTFLECMGADIYDDLKIILLKDFDIDTGLYSFDVEDLIESHIWQLIYAITDFHAKIDSETVFKHYADLAKAQKRTEEAIAHQKCLGDKAKQMLALSAIQQVFPEMLGLEPEFHLRENWKNEFQDYLLICNDFTLKAFRNLLSYLIDLKDGKIEIPEPNQRVNLERLDSTTLEGMIEAIRFAIQNRDDWASFEHDVWAWPNRTDRRYLDEYENPLRIDPKHMRDFWSSPRFGGYRSLTKPLGELGGNFFEVFLEIEEGAGLQWWHSKKLGNQYEWYSYSRNNNRYLFHFSENQDEFFSQLIEAAMKKSRVPILILRMIENKTPEIFARDVVYRKGSGNFDYLSIDLCPENTLLPYIDFNLVKQTYVVSTKPNLERATSPLVSQKESEPDMSRTVLNPTPTYSISSSFFTEKRLAEWTDYLEGNFPEYARLVHEGFTTMRDRWRSLPGWDVPSGIQRGPIFPILNQKMAIKDADGIKQGAILTLTNRFVLINFEANRFTSFQYSDLFKIQPIEVNKFILFSNTIMGEKQLPLEFRIDHKRGLAWSALNLAVGFSAGMSGGDSIRRYTTIQTTKENLERNHAKMYNSLDFMQSVVNFFVEAMNGLDVSDPSRT